MPKIFPVIKKTVVQEIVGGDGPNPSDAFFLAFKLQETSPALTEAMSVAYTFPDTIGVQTDLVKLGLSAADTNPALADLLLRLGLGLTDTSTALSDLLNLGIGFSEGNVSPTDLLAIAFTLADTNPALADALTKLAVSTYGDSMAAPVESLGLRIGFTDSNPSLSDLLAIAFTLADTSPAVADALLSLGVEWAEATAAPTDAVTFQMALTQSDTVPAQSDTVELAFTLPDSAEAPTDDRESLISLWGTGSAGTGVTNPANANGEDNGTTAVVSTAALGATTETLTSNCGNAVAAGTPMPASIVFRGWFKLNTVLSTSTAKCVVHSSTAAFTDIVIESIAAAATTRDHLTTPFVSGELVGTINTLAKLQSAQIVYSTTDLTAGVSPAIVTVDASSLELTGVL